MTNSQRWFDQAQLESAGYTLLKKLPPAFNASGGNALGGVTAFKTPDNALSQYNPAPYVQSDNLVSTIRRLAREYGIALEAIAVFRLSPDNALGCFIPPPRKTGVKLTVNF